MDMRLTVTQSNKMGMMIQHLISLSLLKKSFLRIQSFGDNQYDYEDLLPRSSRTAILEITFDKDYEVDNVKPSDYYAHVPSWLVRLLTARSRNRQEEIE